VRRRHSTVSGKLPFCTLGSDQEDIGAVPGSPSWPSSDRHRPWPRDLEDGQSAGRAGSGNLDSGISRVSA
jgi:hypothetical protein